MRTVYGGENNDASEEMEVTEHEAAMVEIACRDYGATGNLPSPASPSRTALRHMQGQ